MEKSKLNEELEFVRSQIQLFREKTDKIEDGNWRNNVSSDYDKEAIWSAYQRVITDLKSLLTRSYDAE